MIKITIEGLELLDNLHRVIREFRYQYKDFVRIGMIGAAYAIREKIAKRDKELADRFYVYPQEDKVYLLPEISPELFKEYLKSLPKEKRGRAKIQLRRCPQNLYYEPVLVKGVTIEYPKLKTPILQESVDEALSDNTIKRHIVDILRRMLIA